MTSRRRMMAGANLTSLGVADGVIQDDWDKICQIAKAGRAASFYEVGNTKQLSWGYQGTINMMLVGIDADERFDGKGNANMTWLALDFLSKKVPYENKGNSSYGPGIPYNETLIRFYVEGLSILLPDVVRQSIVSVNKTCLFNRTTSVVEAKIWLPSIRELGKKNGDGKDLADNQKESSGPIYNVTFPSGAWTYDEGFGKVSSYVPSRTAWGVNAYQINVAGYVAQDNHVGTDNYIAVGFCL